MTTGANFILLGFGPSYMFIRDEGPWDVHSTVTNDVECVLVQLQMLSCFGQDDELPKEEKPRRVFYIDSDGRMDEIVHRDWEFVKFQPFPSLEEMLTDKEQEIRELAMYIKNGGEISPGISALSVLEKGWGD